MRRTESEGELSSKRKLYFLSKLKGVDHGFRPHYYGPYSSLVAENLDILVNARFVNEVKEIFETDQNIFGEICRHTYSLTTDGKDVMGEMEQEAEHTAWKQKLDMPKQPIVGERF